MLVLSRKVDEQLLIGDDIVITINRISGNRVVIGIEAPQDVRILRGELAPKQEGRQDSSDLVKYLHSVSARPTTEERKPVDA